MKTYAALSAFGVLFVLAAGIKSTEAATEKSDKTAFATRIETGGNCGATHSSKFWYLVNGDTGASYKVTVQTTAKNSGRTVTSQQVKIIAAGGTIDLGCGDSGDIPNTYFTHSVIGEVKR